MDTSRTFFNEELGKLHDSCQSSMSSICVGNDWAEKVSVGKLRTLGFWNGYSLFSLLPVVEELCHEEMTNLIGYSGLSKSVVYLCSASKAYIGIVC
jgi:hypothetical protein